MRRSVSIAVLLLLVACNGTNGAVGPQGPTGATGATGPGYIPVISGQRLTAINRVWVGSDGSRYDATKFDFHDSVLNFDCTVAMASDGVMRCLPPQWYGGFYADPACTRFVTYPPLGDFTGCLPVYVRVQLGESQYVTCGGYYTNERYHRVGPEVTTVYSHQGGVCAEYQTWGLKFYELLEEIPTASFVSFAPN